MRYVGGKARQARYLVGAMAEVWPAAPGAEIWEPFLGGGNVTARLGGRFPDRIIRASDANESIALMWQALIDGMDPPEAVISRDEWEQWKAAPASALRGWYGVAASFNGYFFSTYGAEFDFKAKVGNISGSRDQYHNYVQECAKAARKQVPTMGNAQVRWGDYRTCNPKPGDLMYCDPPYINTAKYPGVAEDFDHGAFWAWCADLVRHGVHVFVSEYVAPPGWQPLLSMERVVTFNAVSMAARPVEHLFQFGEPQPTVEDAFDAMFGA